MKQTFAFILALFLSVTVYGQELQYKEIDKDYSWRKATKTQIDSFYYGLNSIQTSKLHTHLRISLAGQIVDLFSTDGENYGGVLTNIITEYSSEKVKGGEYEQSVAKREVFQKIELDTVKVRFVIDSLISKQIGLPTDSLISNWNANYLHCGSIHFQYNVGGKFKTQEYFCPLSQDDTVPFKAIVVENYSLIKTAFNLDTLYEQFENKLPKGKSYSRDGYRMMYKLTDKQSKNWEKDKPRRDYLESIMDSVDSYINKELGNKDTKLVEINCFEDYQIIFGMNGKLKKIGLSKYDRPRLRNSLGLGDYLDDRKEIRKCKRKIKEIFSEIDLGFLNLEYEISRTLSFDHKGLFQLRDDTMY